VLVIHSPSAPKEALGVVQRPGQGAKNVGVLGLWVLPEDLATGIGQVAHILVHTEVSRFPHTRVGPATALRASWPVVKRFPLGT
jgi:hypothetical protein